MKSNNDTEFKFLCINHDVYDDVKKTLQSIGFRNFKDIRDKSTSHDILAKHDVKGRVKIDKIAQKIFKETENKVSSIQVLEKIWEYITCKHSIIYFTWEEQTSRSRIVRNNVERIEIKY